MHRRNRDIFYTCPNAKEATSTTQSPQAGKAATKTEVQVVEAKEKSIGKGAGSIDQIHVVGPQDHEVKAWAVERKVDEPTTQPPVSRV